MYTYPNTPVQEWTPREVSAWLVASDMDAYRELFLEKGINGSELLQLDSTKLKVRLLLVLYLLLMQKVDD